MAWYNKFPWTNFHELNLDWIMDIVGKAETVLPDATAATEAANKAATLANNNAVAASDAATRANVAARNIDPITATAATVYGASASVTVENTNPGKAFHFMIPAGERGLPGPSGGNSDLIDNGNFSQPVNQRGANSYNGNGAKVYTIDRWFTESNASPAVTINNKYITVAPGAEIKQIIPAENLAEFPSDIDVGYTAVARETNGTVHIANSSGLTDSKLSFTIGDADAGITVTLGSGNWEYCALYKGIFTAENVPGYQPVPYVMQILRCFRFYRRITNMSFSAVTDKILCPCASYLFNFYKNPTASLEGNTAFTPGYGVVNMENPECIAYDSYFQQVAVSNTPFTVNRIYCFNVIFSADL